MTNLKSIQDLVNKQADDPGLWFYAERVTESYLQSELRKLHEIIENKLPELTARVEKAEEVILQLCDPAHGKDCPGMTYFAKHPIEGNQ